MDEGADRAERAEPIDIGMRTASEPNRTVSISEPTPNRADKGEDMPRYLSIYKSVETGHPPTPEEMASMGQLIEEGMKAGYLLAVEGCLPTARGARVRLSGGKVNVTDGPFTESKEVVGGFAILQCASKEEAVQRVREFLHVAGPGECELRELYDAEQAAEAQRAGA
jgi:hypothetical protein